MPPSRYEIRHRGILEILDTGFRIYRSHFLFLVAVIAIPQMVLVPVSLALAGMMTPPTFDPQEPEMGLWLISFYTAVPFAALAQNVRLILSHFVGTAAMLAIIQGRTTSISETIRSVLTRWRVLLGAVALHTLLLSVSSCPCLCNLGSLLYAAFFCFSPHTILFEGEGVFPSYGRSGKLAAGRFWGVMAVLLVCYLGFGLLVTSLVTYPLGALVFIRGLESQGSLFPLIVGLSAAEIVSSCLTYPLVVVTTTLLYLEILVRREGIDLVLACRSQGIDLPESGIPEIVPVQA